MLLVLLWYLKPATLLPTLPCSSILWTQLNFHTFCSVTPVVDGLDCFFFFLSFNLYSIIDCIGILLQLPDLDPGYFPLPPIRSPQDLSDWVGTVGEWQFSIPTTDSKSGWGLHYDSVILTFPDLGFEPLQVVALAVCLEFLSVWRFQVSCRV